MNIAGVFVNGVINKIIDELNDGRLACHFFKIGNILGYIFDERKIIEARFVDYVVDYKNVGSRHIRLKRLRDVFGCRADNLNGAAAETFDFVNQKDVRRLADRDGKSIINLKQRQNAMLLEKFLWQRLDNVRVADFRRYLGVRNAVSRRKRGSDVVFGAVALLDEQFAKQLLMAAAVLMRKDFGNLLGGYNAPLLENFTKL